MEYKQTYKIDNKIHMRPAGNLIDYIDSLRHENISIDLKNLDTGVSYDNKGIIRLVTNFLEGSKVEVIVKGEETEEFLKGIVESVGGHFNFEQKRLNARKIGVII